MEAAVRTVHEIVTGERLPGRMILQAVRGLQGVKEANLKLQASVGCGLCVSCAWVPPGFCCLGCRIVYLGIFPCF